MSNIILLERDSEQLEVKLRKSNLARRLVIRITQKKGVELVIPRRVSVKYATDFLYKKEGWVWLKAKELKRHQKRPFANGVVVPVLGREYTITHSGSLRGVSRIEGDKIIIAGAEEFMPRKVKQLLIEIAREEITAKAHIYAEKIGKKFKKITMKDTTSLWGSCSRKGNLNFSWRIVLAPKEVLEYLVAHEVSHLLHMNHSKKFWDTVAFLSPAYKHHRQWLRRHGDGLHLWGSSDS